MSAGWLRDSRAFFVRDLVRDYCAVHETLAEQKARLGRDGAVSHSTLRDLLGGAIQQSVFWRLKDTAHHLFRNAPGTGSPREENIVLWQYASSPLPDGTSVQNPVEALIDWCVGYAFHECSKLKEDAFQSQHYAGRLAQLGRHAAIAGELYAPLAALGDQTAESLSRELERILHVLRHGLFLLVRYLEKEGENSPLARWLACEEKLARRVFGTLYPALLAALYGARPQRLYSLAAEDFMASGRTGGALALLRHIASRDGLDAEGYALLARLETSCGEPSGLGLCRNCGPAAGRIPPCLQGVGHCRAPGMAERAVPRADGLAWASGEGRP